MRISLVLCIVLAACGASAPPPSAPVLDASSDGSNDSGLPCPSADLTAGSRFPGVVCDQSVRTSRTPRFVTVETCARLDGFYRDTPPPRPITSSRHPAPNACPGVMLVTSIDASGAYL